MGYRFAYATAGDASVSIEIAWPDPLAQPRALVMRRAIPMGYGEQRYDACVTDVQAFTSNGRAAMPAREEGPRWRLEASAGRSRLWVISPPAESHAMRLNPLTAFPALVSPAAPFARRTAERPLPRQPVTQPFQRSAHV